jgi:hypothetical protein
MGECAMSQKSNKERAYIREFLEREYLDNNRPVKDLIPELGLNARMIRYWIAEFGLKKRELDD